MRPLFGLGILVLLAAASAGAQEGGDVARGETLFDIGGCTSCHTAKEGAPLAGGDPIKSPFGDFFAPNITPDPTTGLGAWEEADFVRAMQEGVSPDGSPYYPAFPYTSYTRMSDADLSDLWAYIRTIEPVEQASREHGVGFPFNIRTGLWPWRWLFFEPARFTSDPDRDETWNRGAYLVLGPGHCAECHTPRNFAGALEQDQLFGGSPVGPDGKPVPDISQSADGLEGWSARDLTTLLTLGMDPKGDFIGGEMAKVVEHGTSKLSEDDLAALVGYILSLPPR